MAIEQSKKQKEDMIPKATEEPLATAYEAYSIVDSNLRLDTPEWPPGDAETMRLARACALAPPFAVTSFLMSFCASTTYSVRQHSIPVTQPSPSTIEYSDRRRQVAASAAGRVPDCRQR